MTTRADARGWGPGWPRCQGGNIVTIARADGVRLPVHREIKVLVALLCDETERRGYNLVPGWCWGYACRSIRGSSSPSNHSWGLAVDLNAPKNPMSSRLITDMPGWMPNLWNRFGFRWGGDYSGRKDAMHYEFVGTPSDARKYTEMAIREFGDAPTTGEEDELTSDEKAKLAACYEALFTKRDGKTYEHLNIIEKKLDALAGKQGIAFNKDGTVATT